MSQGNQLNHRNSDSEDGEAASSNDFVIVARSDVLQSAYERLKSYPNQWESTQHTKLELAQDGLYYTGPVPFMVACAFCAITFDVQEKTQQEIRNEHMNKRPQCNLAGNVPLGDVSNYRFEKNRLITFLSINWTAPVDPYDLAKFGFYWTGSADVGRCFACRLEVRGWEPGDQAYTEHMKWNPHCQFILGRNVGNVPIGEEENGLGVDHVAVHSDAIISQQQSMCKHPSYGSEASRLQTYDNWPLSLPQKPIDLAKAGFYYTGRGDRVICFQCGGGLKDWGKGDDPWVEHAVWFQTCAHLLNVKGQAYVDAVQTKVRTQRDQNAALREAGSSSSSSGITVTHHLENETQNASGSPQNDGTEELSEAMAGMSSTLRDLRTCKVCFQKELGIVFLPCGHMATCPDCAPQLQSCPICRGTANDTIKNEENYLDSNCNNVTDNVSDEENIKNLNSINDDATAAMSACRHPKFSTLQSRIASFINWPVHHPESATELADAGFFYTGCGDRVICFHCGGGVKDWMSGDSPWVEHAIWFGNCDFLVANKGQQFVEKVKSITSMQNTNKSGFPEISAEVHEYKVEEMKDENINEHKNDEVEEMKKLENSRTCKICFEKELSILFLPCGHLTACSECAPKMHNCPICRLHPVAYIRAYLP